MTINYADPDDALVEVTCFDNPNHIQLPTSKTNASVVAATAAPVDTSTYNKKDRLDNR